MMYKAQQSYTTQKAAGFYNRVRRIPPFVPCNRRCIFRLLALLLIVTFLSGFGFASYHVVFTLELLPWNPPVGKWCDYEQLPEQMLEHQPDELTVVTMFISLGVFKKGEEPFAYHSPYKYRRWMRTFGKITNKVVAYIELDEDIKYFREIRSCLPQNFTKIIKIDKEDLPAFKHLSRIRQIYADPSYPKHHPNTVHAEYACAMHAKYDVLERTCIKIFNESKFIAWMDIGFFRKLDGTNFQPFKLIAPPTFDSKSIGFSEVWPRSPFSAAEIIKKNLVWVAGGVILATREVMIQFTQDYRHAVEQLLQQGLSNTDQEVIASMYSMEMKQENFVHIQTFKCHQGQMGLYGPAARYMCLGYLCKWAWEQRLSEIDKGHKS